MYSQKDNNKHNTNQIDKILELQQQRLLSVFDRVKQHLFNEFNTLKKQAIEHKQKYTSDKITTQQILSISLPFSDKSRRIRQKLNNTLIYKQIIMNSQMQLAKQCTMNKEEEIKAKANFDLICDYKQRSEQNKAGKQLYTQNVCKHLVRKTFKKTAMQIYQTVSSTQLRININQQIKIVCIGGGPGSDLCGIITHLIQLGIKNITAKIYDYNYEKWNSVSKKLQSIIANQSKKLGIQIFLTIQWKFIDMTKDNSKQVQQIIQFKPHLISNCWALNEDLFNKQFWLKLITYLSQTTFVFVDGNRYPLEHIMQVKGNKRVQYSWLTSPRTLILHSQ